MVRESEIASQRKFSLGLCHCRDIEPGEGGGQEAGGRIDHIVAGCQTSLLLKREKVT